MRESAVGSAGRNVFNVLQSLGRGLANMLAPPSFPEVGTNPDSWRAPHPHFGEANSNSYEVEGNDNENNSCQGPTTEVPRPQRASTRNTIRQVLRNGWAHFENVDVAQEFHLPVALEVVVGVACSMSWRGMALCTPSWVDSSLYSDFTSTMLALTNTRCF